MKFISVPEAQALSAFATQVKCGMSRYHISDYELAVLISPYSKEIYTALRDPDAEVSEPAKLAASRLLGTYDVLSEQNPARDYDKLMKELKKLIVAHEDCVQTNFESCELLYELKEVVEKA